jgi:hypothetical protein
MGSSNSLISSFDNVVYICYDLLDKENEPKYQNLFHQLKQKNFIVINSSNTQNDEINYDLFTKNMNDFVNRVPFIIVCLNNNYLKCAQQIKELNTIMDREYNIIYIKMEKEEEEEEEEQKNKLLMLKCLVKTNELIVYNENNMEEILNKIKI